MSLWADLENAVGTQVATEAAFLSVQTLAKAGLRDPTQQPAAIIYRPTSTVKSVETISGATRVMWEAMIVVLITTRISGAIGDSRLATGGVYDLADKLRAKLLGFTPNLAGTASVLATWPMVPKEELLVRVEPGAVDMECIYTVDILSQI